MTRRDVRVIPAKVPDAVLRHYNQDLEDSRLHGYRVAWLYGYIINKLSWLLYIQVGQFVWFSKALGLEIIF